MSLDRTLKSKRALARSRNVLTRAERIAKLTDEERWDTEQSVFGLPKVAARRRTAAGSKSKAPAAEAQAPAAGAAGDGAEK